MKKHVSCWDEGSQLATMALRNLLRPSCTSSEHTQVARLPYILLYTLMVLLGVSCCLAEYPYFPRSTSQSSSRSPTLAHLVAASR